MAILVGVETVLLVLLGILVLGLLRSHAEILRVQSASSETAARREAVAEAARTNGNLPERAIDIVGVNLDLEASVVELSNPPNNVLLAFLTSGCLACEDFWRLLARGGGRLDLPGGGDVIVVAKNRTDDSLSRLRKLASAETRVVLSTEAWKAYDASAAPYFVHVAAGGRVLGGGVSERWEQLRATLEGALEDVAIDDALRAAAGAAGANGGKDER